jgi:Tol biopolymer transport system component
VYVVSAEGGTPQELIPNDSNAQVDPNWSIDGGKVVFAGNPGESNSQIKMFELIGERVSSLPGSQSMFSPRWSP